LDDGKALNSFMCLTDGAPFSLMQVNYLKSNSKKPSMSVLSNLYKLKSHSSIKQGPLNNFNWKQLFDNKVSPNDFPNLDVLIENHIDLFWKDYQLFRFFRIECKVSNMFTRAATFLKGHYAFLTYNPLTKEYDQLLTKIRGVSKRDVEDPNVTHNPIYDLLVNILNKQNEFKFKRVYQRSSLISISLWRISTKRIGKEIISNFENAKPGERYVKNYIFTINNNFKFLSNKKEFETINTRSLRKMNFLLNDVKQNERRFMFESGKFFGST
jgi:hypothetical protein